MIFYLLSRQTVFSTISCGSPGSLQKIVSQRKQGERRSSCRTLFANSGLRRVHHSRLVAGYSLRLFSVLCILVFSANCFSRSVFKAKLGDPEKAGWGATSEEACDDWEAKNPDFCIHPNYEFYTVGKKCVYSCLNDGGGGYVGNFPVSERKCLDGLVMDLYNAHSGGYCVEELEEKNEPDLCESTGAPVNYSTGNKLIAEIDLPSQGPGGLEFSRSWNSYDQVWRFSYSQYLKDVEQISGLPRTRSVVRDDGGTVIFAHLGDKWLPELDVHEQLVELDGEWLYIESSGDKEWFDSNGRLIRTRRADGRGLTITYPATGTIQILDDYGSHLDLVIDDAGRVAAMTDPDGQAYRYAYDASGNLEYVSYPDATPGESGANPFGEDNPVRRYHYDDPGDFNLVTGITDENGDLYKTIAYDAQGRATLSGLSDGSVGHSTLDYSEIDHAYDPRVTVTNSLGKDTVYHLENHFGVTRVAVVEGESSANCLADVQSKQYYAEHGWLQRKVDKAGNTTYYEYYTDGGRYGLLKKRVEAEASPQERIFTFDWYADSRRKKQQVLIDQKQTDYVYYSNGRLQVRTETDLTTTTLPYSTYGNTRAWTYSYTYHDPGTDLQVASLTVDGPRIDVADTTVAKYSAQGFLVSITNALGQSTWYYDHNGRGQPGKIEDSNGVVTDLDYTSRGWLRSITRDAGGIGAATEFHYDNVGQLTAVTLADGVHHDFEFDEAHRLEAVQNSLGQRIRYALDAAGNRDLISYIDAGGAITREVNYNFDELGRLLEEAGAHGQQISYSYDDKGHLQGINDGVNPATQLAFDALNRLETVTDAKGNPLFIAHDSDDRVEQVTDQRGLATNYIYDGFGNLKQLKSPDSGITVFHYDAAGNRIKQTDARGVVADYAYDALNRLKAVTYPDEPENNVAYNYDNWLYCNRCNGYLSLLVDRSGTTAYTYDTLGQVDHRANIVNLPDGSTVSLTTEFTFAPIGRLQAVQYPGGKIVTYDVNTAGQVEKISYAGVGMADPQTVVADVKFEPFGPLRDMTYGNNLQLHRGFDLDGRLETQTISGVQDLAYFYDYNDNIDHIKDAIDPGRDEHYGYDASHRLATAAGKYGAIVYDYDEVGNRTLRLITRRGQATEETYTYAPTSNRLDSVSVQTGAGLPLQRSYLYDAAGNLTEEARPDGTHLRPHYDSANRMDSVSQ